MHGLQVSIGHTLQQTNQPFLKACSNDERAVAIIGAFPSAIIRLAKIRIQCRMHYCRHLFEVDMMHLNAAMFLRVGSERLPFKSAYLLAETSVLG
ncbi:MAG TPA: hypothetical protein DER02_10435 [Gammaproteobacteria bacterium]|nr:hypothetical protein [Gammaproteobacteria bacterium]